LLKRGFEADFLPFIYALYSQKGVLAAIFSGYPWFIEHVVGWMSG